MINTDELVAAMDEPALSPWRGVLPDQLRAALAPGAHGDLHDWLAALAGLPAVQPSSLDLNADRVRIGEPSDCDGFTRDRIERSLRRLHPWRKGPYSVFGIHIDSEWHSDWKWQRLEPHIQRLDGRLVLDVGCGNGYHCWRATGAGARLTLGIDPTLRYVAQFQALKRFVPNLPVHLLPLGIEQVPPALRAFDTVFSMGVLYHRRSPLDHLMELRGCLRSGGELVLETLVIEGDDGQVLLPPERYARMRNVWFIPSAPTLVAWLARCGFVDPRLVDINRTSTEEQRTTDWMTFQSLADFLDPGRADRTIEGLPAPRRAIVVAAAP